MFEESLDNGLRQQGENPEKINEQSILKWRQQHYYPEAISLNHEGRTYTQSQLDEMDAAIDYWLEQMQK